MTEAEKYLLERHWMDVANRNAHEREWYAALAGELIASLREISVREIHGERESLMTALELRRIAREAVARVEEKYNAFEAEIARSLAGS